MVPSFRIASALTSAKSPSIWVTFLVSLVLLFQSASVHWNRGLEAVSDRTSGQIQVRSTTNSLEGLESWMSKREDYTCDASRPCSNGACCGATGICGYGPTFCGDGCISNCNATAECGQYASVVNTTCPLNVCCSEYGFCGTTEDYCTGNCQSNCDLDPKPPSDSSGEDALSKVIGYYEGWSYNSDCHTTYPTDLPLSALTHVNFAFAYIEPNTYEVSTMEADMPASLYSKTTAIKDINPSLKVFVSIGGWTFSDNDTVTQPLFGEIAGDSTKRDTFASNVLKFLNTYGFDGVDLDWEYPGAPDRGGSKEDTDNYVELVKTLRAKFDSSGKTLGITFTAPSSYWYLRWFDLPGMMKYCDWLNFMTYDLHGIWDATNPIGSIVQAHTNLTDIKLATQLLWRVDIKPSQVAMGFGFYGRSFTLQDPSCKTPGCPFSGGGTEGVCTATSGYLAYYEIQDILQKNPSAELIHDEKAAVKYLTWDNNQWISFDDADTFQQKLDWANDVGLGGSLIWASDQDDYEWSAHSALLNKTIPSNEEALTNLVSKAVVQRSTTLINDKLATSCYRADECTDLRNPQVTCPETGYKLVGYDRGDCNDEKEDYMGQAICCKTTSAPKSCTWRGGGLDCNGQCHKGEATLFSSKVGGGSWNGFTSQSGTSTCNRGTKAFCCEDPEFADVTEGCRWTDCGKSCDDDEEDVAFTKNLDDSCGVFVDGNHYCCKKPAKIQDCRWVGEGDCADNTCASSEIELLTNDVDDNGDWCNWWRQKALCCTAIEPTPVDCSSAGDLCDLYPWCYDEDVDGTAPDSTPSEKKRDQLSVFGALGDEDDDDEDLDKRGPARQFGVLAGQKAVTNVLSFGYAGLSNYFSGGRSSQVLNKAFAMSDNWCSTTAMIPIDIPKTSKILQADHCYELQNVPTILQSAISGYLPSGARLQLPTIAQEAIVNTWNTPVAALGSLSAYKIAKYKVYGRKANPLIPNDRVMWQIGSLANARPLILISHNVNLIKGMLFDFAKDSNGVFTGKLRRSLTDSDEFDNYLSAALSAGGKGIHFCFEPIRETMGALNTLARSEIIEEINNVRLASFAEFQNYENAVPEVAGITDIWRAVDYDTFSFAIRQAKFFIQTRLMDITEAFQGVSPKPDNYEEVVKTLQMISKELLDYDDPALVSPK